MVNTLTAALLWHGRSRGSQSAGIHTPGHLIKRAMDPTAFIRTKAFRRATSAPATFALCHTRAPTSGGLGHAQAQPFILDDTITVHNGWFSNVKELKDKWNLQKASGVDSELVTAFIHDHGIALLPDFLDSTSGTHALGILHKGKMYVCRDGSPLEYHPIKVGSNDICVFASTSSILEAALHHTWLMPPNFKTTTITWGNVYELTPKGLGEKSKSYSATTTYRVMGRIHDPYGADMYLPDHKSSPKKGDKKTDDLEFWDSDWQLGPWRERQRKSNKPA